MQIGHINFGKKLTGKRSVGKPHAAFDVEGDGNGARLATAPLLDPTCEKLRGEILFSLLDSVNLKKVLNQAALFLA